MFQTLARGLVFELHQIERAAIPVSKQEDQIQSTLGPLTEGVPQHVLPRQGNDRALVVTAGQVFGEQPRLVWQEGLHVPL